MIWKKGNFKFSDKKHSIRGIVSMVLGIAALISLGILLYLSSTSKGNGGTILGVVGMSSFLLTIIGLYLGIRGFKEKEIMYTFPLIGVVLNGILFVIYLVVYLMGFSL